MIERFAVGLAHLLDRALDQVSDDRDGSRLAHTNCSRNSLLFNGGIPLRFDDVHVIGSGEVESCQALASTCRIPRP
jgi:hypothetical protein